MVYRYVYEHDLREALELVTRIAHSDETDEGLLAMAGKLRASVQARLEETRDEHEEEDVTVQVVEKEYGGDRYLVDEATGDVYNEDGEVTGQWADGAPVG